MSIRNIMNVSYLTCLSKIKVGIGNDLEYGYAKYGLIRTIHLQVKHYNCIKYWMILQDEQCDANVGFGIQDV